MIEIKENSDKKGGRTASSPNRVHTITGFATNRTNGELTLINQRKKNCNP